MSAIDELISRVVARAPHASAREVCELLWLMEQLASGRSVEEELAELPEAETEEVELQAALLAPPASEAPTPSTSPAPVTRDLEGPGSTEPSPRPAVASETGTRDLALQAIPATTLWTRLGLGRALHRLGEWEAVGSQRLDVAATVRATAEARGDPILVFSREQSPATHLIVVEDRAPQLAPFREEFRELRAAVGRSTCFAASTWIETDLAELRPVLTRDGLPVRLRSVPEGPRVLVLLVTDGLGDGLAALADDLMTSLPGSARVAWAHPWRQRSQRTVPHLGVARAGALAGAAATSGPIAAMVPLDPKGLGRLEGFVRGRPTMGRRLCDPRPRAPAPDPTERPGDRALRFATRAPRDVMLLLGLLAAVPARRMDLELMVAIGDRFLPAHGLGARQALAEALASGWLVRTEGSRLCVTFAEEEQRSLALTWLDATRLDAVLHHLLDLAGRSLLPHDLGVPVDLLLRLRGDELDPTGPATPWPDAVIQSTIRVARLAGWRIQPDLVEALRPRATPAVEREPPKMDGAHDAAGEAHWDDDDMAVEIVELLPSRSEVRASVLSKLRADSTAILRAPRGYELAEMVDAVAAALPGVVVTWGPPGDRSGLAVVEGTEWPDGIALPPLRDDDLAIVAAGLGRNAPEVVRVARSELGGHPHLVRILIDAVRELSRRSVAEPAGPARWWVVDRIRELGESLEGSRIGADLVVDVAFDDSETVRRLTEWGLVRPRTQDHTDGAVGWHLDCSVPLAGEALTPRGRYRPSICVFALESDTPAGPRIVDILGPRIGVNGDEQVFASYVGVQEASVAWGGSGASDADAFLEALDEADAVLLVGDRDWAEVVARASRPRRRPVVVGASRAYEGAVALDADAVDLAEVHRALLENTPWQPARSALEQVFAAVRAAAAPSPAIKELRQATEAVREAQSRLASCRAGSGSPEDDAREEARLVVALHDVVERGRPISESLVAVMAQHNELKAWRLAALAAEADLDLAGTVERLAGAARITLDRYYGPSNHLPVDAQLEVARSTVHALRRQLERTSSAEAARSADDLQRMARTVLGRAEDFVRLDTETAMRLASDRQLTEQLARVCRTRRSTTLADAQGVVAALREDVEQLRSGRGRVNQVRSELAVLEEPLERFRREAALSTQVPGPAREASTTARSPDPGRGSLARHPPWHVARGGWFLREASSYGGETIAYATLRKEDGAIVDQGASRRGAPIVVGPRTFNPFGYLSTDLSVPGLRFRWTLVDARGRLRVTVIVQGEIKNGREWVPLSSRGSVPFRFSRADRNFKRRSDGIDLLEEITANPWPLDAGAGDGRPTTVRDVQLQAGDQVWLGFGDHEVLLLVR